MKRKITKRLVLGGFLATFVTAIILINDVILKIEKVEYAAYMNSVRTSDGNIIQYSSNSKVNNVSKEVLNVELLPVPTNTSYTEDDVIERSMAAFPQLLLHALKAKHVFYNRIPRTGSEGVMLMTRSVAKQNGFEVLRSHNMKDRHLNISQQVSEMYHIMHTQI